MPILTAQQPITRAPDTAALVKDAYQIISQELAARTNLAQLSAQQLQQQYVNQAAGRMEVAKNFQDRYAADRQARQDDLNNRIQMAQDARAERKMKMEEQLFPLELQSKQLSLDSGRFNLSSAKTLLPYKVEGARAEVEGQGLQNEGARTRNEVAEYSVPAAKAAADLNKQEAELRTTAVTSLQNVTDGPGLMGWIGSQMGGVSKVPSDGIAAALRRASELGLAPAEIDVIRKVAEDQSARNLQINKGADSSGLMPMTSGNAILDQLVKSGSSFMQDENGRIVSLTQFPLSEINQALKENQLGEMTQADYDAIPRPRASSSQSVAEERLELERRKARSAALSRQGDTFLKMAQDAEENQRTDDAIKYRAQAEDYKRRASEALGGLGSDTELNPRSVVLPTGTVPRRASVMSILPPVPGRKVVPSSIGPAGYPGK